MFLKSYLPLKSLPRNGRWIPVLYTIYTAASYQISTPNIHPREYYLGKQYLHYQKHFCDVTFTAMPKKAFQIRTQTLAIGQLTVIFIFLSAGNHKQLSSPKLIRMTALREEGYMQYAVTDHGKGEPLDATNVQVWEHSDLASTLCSFDCIINVDRL